MLAEKGKECRVDNHRFLLRHSTIFQILSLFSTLRLNSLKTRIIDSGVRWSWIGSPVNLYTILHRTRCSINI